MYQPGIFALGTPENAYLELDTLPGATFKELVETLVNLSQPISTRGGVNLVIGLRPSKIRELQPGSVPADAADFSAPVVGDDGFTMPATQHDAWLWVAGADRSSVFDNATFILREIADVATVASEEWGWHYKESRDLTGFVDGTENPSLLQAPPKVIVPNGKPGAGSCVLLYQKWRHEADMWMALSKDQQESAIGRTKDDDEEMDPKPKVAHASRTVVEVDGEEIKIFRRNVAYGGASEHGTLFVGFSQDQWRQAEMLRRMAGVKYSNSDMAASTDLTDLGKTSDGKSGDGIRDALTRFTTPLSGSYYVIPDTQALAAFLVDDEDDE